MAATKQTLDFTNVKESSGFNPKHLPAGDYRAKITGVEDKPSKAGNAQWVWTIVLTTDQRAAYPLYTGLDEKQLWKVRNLFMAAGINVPKKRVAVDPNKLIGREIGISLEDDEYEGKMKSVIIATFPADDLTGDSPEDAGSSVDDEDTPDAEETDDDEVSDSTEETDDELELDEL